MRKRRLSSAVHHPVTLKGRIYLSGVVILIALVLGFATSIGLYQATKTHLRESTLFGRLLCGEGQWVDDAPSNNRSRRMICRNADGVEVSERNNLIAVKMALPFILLYAGTGLLAAWTVGAGSRRPE
ncbi:MAG: hypothetical protein KL863_01620 [Rhizobium sp.]|nr:hypothetical protein [Rhizobium sp.]